MGGIGKSGRRSSLLETVVVDRGRLVLSFCFCLVVVTFLRAIALRPDMFLVWCRFGSRV